jgi:hypothetical protein
LKPTIFIDHQQHKAAINEDKKMFNVAIDQWEAEEAAAQLEALRKEDAAFAALPEEEKKRVIKSRQEFLEIFAEVAESNEDEDEDEDEDEENIEIDLDGGLSAINE